MPESTTNFRIGGKAIYLRTPQESDLDAFYNLMQDPESGRLTGTQKEFTREEIAAWLKKISVPHEDRVDFIIVLKDTDELIGEVVLNDMDLINKSANIRISIHSEHNGKGYGSETMVLMLRHGFETLKLHRIHLGVYEYNPRAIHVYEKIGFKQEGILRDELYLEGEYHDLLLMSMLEDEFYDKYSKS